ncbi:MAG TPA: multidrug efflux RND transporter permease subunit [Steroidobacteraceae bacterium]|nr:multidrug efflux RND transporter permease subunit [Steroidobacteraceae bacterium]
MKFAHFFIDRPIFAAVLSIIIFLAGLLSLQVLPVSEYPEVAPPSVVVSTAYPGASPAVVAETVAAPLEQAINGVENMLYMSSQASSSGALSITVTFNIGTNIDLAQVQVQNRVAQALTKLPEDVRRIGVNTVKSNPNITMFVQLVSPNGRYDLKYLRNYAELQVRDTLARIPGMGQVETFGGGPYSMRVWLDPQRVAARNMTAGDVVAAIREQNVQVAAGVVGSQPMTQGVDQQLLLNAYGRLASEEEFADIIIKTGERGELTRLRDVARIELGTSEYGILGYLDGMPAVAIAIFQAPGSNALELADNVRATMQDLSRNFPEGVEYRVIYDPTQFVRHSIDAVVETLVEALLLVVLVVVLFLQTWRASIIPLLAVPVSIVGTFAVLHLLGFSINTLSLFGLVLAIGIVVDDAIVVVENVERNIADGLSPRDATFKAMDEVSGPIIAIALVLTAVFIPIAFIGGLTGSFYRQFAITIAISTLISAFNSLTLSPALAAALLKPHDAPKDLFTRFLDRTGGWVFRPFNRFFTRASGSYSRGVGRVLRKSAVAIAVYAGLLLLGGLALIRVPGGFVPVQDKDYIIAFAQLPDAATLERTEEVIKRISDTLAQEEGVEAVIAFSGMSVTAGFGIASNSGVVFATLEPRARRTGDRSADEILAAVQGKLFAIEDAFVGVAPPPPVEGMGTLGGFKMQIQDRSSLGYQELNRVLQEFLAEANQTPGITGVFSNYLVNVPQLYADIDREKAKREDIPLANIFEALQVYLGSLYVNDLNLFGRSYQVIAQADAGFRARKEQVLDLKTRNLQGGMVPLGSVMTVKDSFGPDSVTHYNGYLAADINGQAMPGTSSSAALDALESLAREKLPAGVSFEWTDLSYQEILARGSSTLIFPLCVLLAFLVLAAQYESWTLPLAVILIVPMCIVSALTGVWLVGGDNNIFTKIGFLVLVGLACKNAILIVEFAVHLEERGRNPFDAAVEACRLRLRPIIMTSLAFIMGVVPLMLSTGAGSEMRRAMGVAVFSGMLGVTFFGLFLTPVFFVLIRGFVKRRREAAHAAA